MHLIPYYGLYSSRTRGKLNKTGNLIKLKPDVEKLPGRNSSRQSWARLLKKVYEVDPFICLKCGGDMKIIAIITNRVAIDKIIDYLEKNKSPPFDKILAVS